MFWNKEPDPPKNDYSSIIIVILLLMVFAKYGKKGLQFQIFKPTNKLLDVVGLETVKKEIEYYMEFIKNKEKYLDWKVKLPKGILLSGPPGTGKTLLVKTIASKLDIPLISTCGSEFVEMYVGVGAMRIRQLFEKAKEQDACIIFIDEIDAVGTKRDAIHNSERATTLNQLLVEMDGFDEKNNIIVFAATNLIKNLDPALTRSGRFDKKIYFDLPNNNERIEMYKLYLKNMNLPQDISYKTLSERTAGVSGADIANIANQTKINAIQNQNEKNTVTEKDIQTAIDEVLIGREKRERILTPEERERVSYHEAGHCLMGYMLQHTDQPIKVSIIPRGEAALGFSQQKPSNKKLMIEEEILCRIAVLLGGRVAEFIMYNNASTGASDDIEKISVLLTNYSINWGMNSQIGPININSMGKLGEYTAESVMEQCKTIIDKIEKQTIEILKTNKDYMIKIAQSLLENETIDYKKIQSLVPSELENTELITLNTRLRKKRHV